MNWEKRMDAKKSLHIYKIGKPEITGEMFLDSTKGSALLFEVGASCLKTKTLVPEQLQDKLCRDCGRELETMWHIVAECKHIHPVPSERGIQLPEALGFNVNRNVKWKAVEVIKEG